MILRAFNVRCPLLYGASLGRVSLESGPPVCKIKSLELDIHRNNVLDITFSPFERQIKLKSFSFTRMYTLHCTSNATLTFFGHNNYSPFHSSLPFQHLGQSCFCINQETLFNFRTETVSQMSGVLEIYSVYL